jgi:hypothetical protein
VTNKKKHSLVLDPQPLQNGLNNRALWALTGYQVSSHDLSTFEGWDQILHGLPLSPFENARRVEAIRKIIPFDLAKKVASFNLPINYTNLEHLTNHPDLLRQLETLPEGQTILSMDMGQRHVIYPYPQSKPKDPSALGVPYSAKLFLFPPQGNPKTLWSLFTGLPEKHLVQYPQNYNVHLTVNLHEVAHTMMVVENDRTEHDQFWEELACDRFALQVTAANNPQGESARAWIRGRYMGLLTDRPIYWFAPHLEADMNGQTPPSPKDINVAVQEIRSSLLKASRTNSSWSQRLKIQLSNDPYRTWMQEAIQKNPAKGYSLLRTLTEQGAFKENPLAETLAQKILDAAEHFSPNLTRHHEAAPSRPSHKAQAPAAPQNQK